MLTNFDEIIEYTFSVFSDFPSKKNQKLLDRANKLIKNKK